MESTIISFFSQNYEALGLTLAGGITLYFLFKDVYNKLKDNKDSLEKFKEEQGKKCENHIKDGQYNFERVEQKIDKVIDMFNLGFTNLNTRVETMTNHIIDFFKENRK